MQPTSPQIWIWFETSHRWLPGTFTGAREQFIEFGREVAYGRRPPKRAGESACVYPPLMRPGIFDRFALAIRQETMRRHRVFQGC